MNKHLQQQTLGVALAISCLTLPVSAHGAETEPEFGLEPINVTAQGYQQKNIDTPADTRVYTSAELKKTGATNVAGALKYQAGLIFSGNGPMDQTTSTGMSKITLRGVNDGTLVLLNGIPMSFSQVYHLDQISLEQVERVEIVKGGGAVLYGSEAFGGVINVITKDKVENTVTIGTGDAGQRNYNMTLQAGKSSFVVGRDEYGATPNMTEVGASGTTGLSGHKYLTAYGDSNKNRFSWNYKFDDHLNLQYIHHDKAHSILYHDTITNDLLKEFDYNEKENFVQLQYKKDDVKVNMFLHDRNIDYQDWAIRLPKNIEWETMETRNYGIDAQKVWNTDSAKFLGGITLKRETFDNYNVKMNSNTTMAPMDHFGVIARNEYSLYGQWDQKLSAVTRAVFSVREDIVTGQGAQDLKAFLPQLQLITKITDHSSVYFNAGKSFRVPTFRNLYYSSYAVKPNPDLKAETGKNYEIGYKVEDGSANWNVALFKVEIDNQITSRNIGKGLSQPYNAVSYENTGVEISYDKKINDHLSYTVGGMYSNPKRQEALNAPWKRVLGRLQFVGALHYNDDLTTASLSTSYFGNRVMYGTQKDSSPMLMSNLHVTHKLSKNYVLNFDVDNLFNRHDAVNNSTDSIDYYTMPRTYRLGVTLGF